MMEQKKPLLEVEDPWVIPLTQIKPQREIVDMVDLWLAEFVDRGTGLCGLCGNTGYIDTRKSAVSPAGVRSGGVFTCICPTGRAAKQQEWAIEHGMPYVIRKGEE